MSEPEVQAAPVVKVAREGCQPREVARGATYSLAVGTDATGVITGRNGSIQ